MKIWSINATTFYTGLIVSVRGTYTKQSAYKIFAERAFEIYKRKVEQDFERLSKFDLRLCITESEPGQDGIVRPIRTTFRDFRLIDGKVTMIKEHVQEKTK